MSPRAFILAVTGCAFTGCAFLVAACGSYGTSVVEVGNTRTRVASVSVAVPLSLAAGQMARAIATPKDANGAALTDRPVIWYTSSASIASVSGSGLISAVAPGTTVVSAVSEGVAGQATMAVVPPPPTPIATLSVAVDPSAVLIGQTAQATATLADSSGNPISGRTVTWESSDTSVATVDTGGTVKARGPGNAMIKASASGMSNFSLLSVTAPAPVPVASVSVSPITASLQVGASVQLSAVTRDSSNTVLTGRVIGWSSANTGIATVSSSGLVTAVTAGNVSITASSEGQTASAAITVSAPAPIPVASVSVSPATATVQVGGTVQFSAVTRDANNNVLTGRSISWNSGNLAIATVSASGLATAVAAGTVQITATSEGKSGSATLTDTSSSPPSGVNDALWRKNEPAGMTTISDRPWNAFNELGWGDHTGSGQEAIVSDATAPHSPSSVLHSWWPANYLAGNGPSGGDKTFAPYRTIYVAYWSKLSANFYGQPFTKQFYMYTSTYPYGAVPYFATVGYGMDPLVPQMRQQGSVSWSPGPVDGNLDPNLVPTARVPRAEWYLIEAIFVGNTAGNQDGSVDWYLNGVHIGSYAVQWEPGNVTWQRFHYTTVWGGTVNYTPYQFEMWWDQMYVSGKN